MIPPFCHCISCRIHPSAGLSPAVDNAESDSILGEAYMKSGNLASAEKNILASSLVLGDWSRTWNLLGIIRQRKEISQKPKNVS